MREIEKLTHQWSYLGILAQDNYYAAKPEAIRSKHAEVIASERIRIEKKLRELKEGKS